MYSFILCIESRQLENTMPFLDTFLHFRERTASSRRGAVLGADREKVGKKRNNESPDSAIPSRSGEAQRLGKPCPPCVMGKKSNLADGDKALRSKQLLRNDASEGAEFTDDGYASLLKGRDLVLAPARRAADDGPGMAHALSGWGGQARNEPEYRFRIAGLSGYIPAARSSASPPISPMRHTASVSGSSPYRLEQVHEAQPVDGVAANADTRALPEPAAVSWCTAS